MCFFNVGAEVALVGGLKLLARLSLLTEQDLWTVNGLPNENNSSDHLPLLAKFRLELWLLITYILCFPVFFFSPKECKVVLKSLHVYLFLCYEISEEVYVKCLKQVTEETSLHFSFLIMKKYFPDKWDLNAVHCKKSCKYLF